MVREESKGIYGTGEGNGVRVPVFEVDGLPAQSVARPLPRVHAAVEDLEDGILVDALVVRFVPNATSNARLKHCRYWI